MSFNTEYAQYNLWNSQSVFYPEHSYASPFTNIHSSTVLNSPSIPRTISSLNSNTQYFPQTINTVSNQLLNQPLFITNTFSKREAIKTVTSIINNARETAKAGNREETLRHLQLLKRFKLSERDLLKVFCICKWIDNTTIWLFLVERPIFKMSISHKVFKTYCIEVEHLCTKNTPNNDSYAIVEHTLKQATLPFIKLKDYWYLSYILARFYERNKNNEQALIYYDKTIKNCSPSYTLKVHLARAHLHNTAAAFTKRDSELKIILDTLSIAYREYKSKHTEHIYIHLTGFYFLIGNVTKAIEVLTLGLNAIPNEWKLWFFAIQFYQSIGESKQAEALLDFSLNKFIDKSRFYILKTQPAYNCKSEQEALEIILQGLENIPKSGELLCELARFHLNPLSTLFDLEKASTLLQEALLLTPQYGDIYIELIRCKFLREGLDADISDIVRRCHFEESASYGELWESCQSFFCDTASEVCNIAKSKIQAELHRTAELYFNKPSVNKSFPSTILENDPLKKWSFEHLMKAFSTPISYSPTKLKQQLEFFLENSELSIQV